jgi:hypothetical protein
VRQRRAHLFHAARCAVAVDLLNKSIVPTPTAKPVHAPVHLRLRRSNNLHQRKTSSSRLTALMFSEIL